MKNKELFNTLQSLIEMSPTSDVKILEMVLGDVQFYEAILCDPQFFVKIRENNWATTLYIPAKVVNLDIFEKFTEEEAHTIFQCLRKIFLGCMDSSSVRTILNSLFGHLNSSFNKFTDFYMYVADTNYAICRNDSYTSLQQTIKLAMQKTLVWDQLCYNEQISFEQLQEIYKKHGDMVAADISTSRWNRQKDDGPITTNTLKKLTYSFKTGFFTGNVSPAYVLNHISLDCDEDTIIEFINDIVLEAHNTHSLYYYNHEMQIALFDTLYKFPKLIKHFGDNEYLIKEYINTAGFDLNYMYAFIIKDEYDTEIKKLILNKINQKNSKIFVNVFLPDEEIAAYIKMFNRKTIQLSSNRIEREKLLKLCIQNDIKLSRSSEIFDIGKMSKEIAEAFLTNINNICDTYGCNSRVLLEFANDAGLILHIDQDKIESEELLQRYHNYLLKGAL